MIGMDHCFPSSKGADSLTVIAFRESESSAVHAIVVPRKGRGEEWAIKKINKIIDEDWGKKKVIMRNDGEPAIKAFRKAIQEHRIEDTILEQSPKGDSASNGLAEEAVKTIEGMVRTWIDAVECKYGMKMALMCSSPGSLNMPVKLSQDAEWAMTVGPLIEDLKENYHRQ